ncbi:MAG: multicopper oxidase domain-containing protein [Verrucomicrobia bacterium]|nr:multicopper oxidase domain-containing protein [Verrucomicrobiota bacterium]
MMKRRIHFGIWILAGGLILSLALAYATFLPDPAAPPTDTEVGLDGMLLRPYRGMTVGDVNKDLFDADAYLTHFETGSVSLLPDGRTLREFVVVAVNKEIEIAPGVMFPAWTYNGQVPGPTLRATDGDLIRIYFKNRGDRPHSMHFHGFHPASMDGAVLKQLVPPGGDFVYEFNADPAGVHLYHCHATPLTQHIHNGLYGFWIVDPKEARAPAKEMVMMLNGFDTNFDEENEVYAVNTIAFHYARHPIKVRQHELLRIYLANITEFDFLNSFHVHATFFDYYPTGTQPEPRDFTDTVIQGQGERGLVELKFPYPGRYMFHAHKTEFAERGWMGFFDVEAAEGPADEG